MQRQRFLAGSSPRVRGTRDHTTHTGAKHRFIPARAGNTDLSMAGVKRKTVHPRACGEHELSGGGSALARGSSPRVRGTPVALCIPPFPGRFIPARAGNTVPCTTSQRQGTVHPRACGEHRRATALPRHCGGSSPRVRGTPEGQAEIGIPRRFIPARAGNTCLTPH